MSRLVLAVLIAVGLEGCGGARSEAEQEARGVDRLVLRALVHGRGGRRRGGVRGRPRGTLRCRADGRRTSQPARRAGTETERGHAG